LLFAARGAGALKFGFPSLVRGIPGVGYFSHCPCMHKQVPNKANRIQLSPPMLPIKSQVSDPLEAGGTNN